MCRLRTNANHTYRPFVEIVSGGEKTRFQYEGKEFDSVLGDYDFNVRRDNTKWCST